MGWARGADKEAGPGRALSVSSEQQPNIDFASFFVRFTTVIHMVWKFCLGLRHVVFTTSCLRESKVSDPDGSVNTYGLRRLASPSPRLYRIQSIRIFLWSRYGLWAVCLR